MKIQQTKNYSMFKMDPCNRQVRKLTKIRRSMMKYGFLEEYPIRVVRTERGLVITDGQHRFEAAKSLGIALHYVIVEPNVKFSIPEINCTQSPWNLRDYLTSHCQQGKRDYLAVKEFSERTGIGLQQSTSLLAGEMAGSANHADLFKAGKFVIKDPDYAELVGEFITWLKPKMKWATDRAFVQAISRIFRVKEFKVAVLKQKVESWPSMLVKQPNVEAYTVMLDALYNHKARYPIPLKFLTDQAMRKRIPIKSAK